MRLLQPAPHSNRRLLVTLNVALLCALGAVTWWGSYAQAQSQRARARGEYTMIAGRTSSGGPAAIYLVDSSNQELVALRWDTGKQALVGLGYRNMAGDGRAASPGR